MSNVCFNCRGDAKDASRFETQTRKGITRIVLKKATGTLWCCPKCGAAYPMEDFKNKQNIRRKQNEKVAQRKKRIEVLKRMHQNS